MLTTGCIGRASVAQKRSYTSVVSMPPPPPPIHFVAQPQGGLLFASAQLQRPETPGDTSTQIKREDIEMKEDEKPELPFPAMPNVHQGNEMVLPPELHFPAMPNVHQGNAIAPQRGLHYLCIQEPQ